MYLRKTDKAVAVLATRDRTLALKARALLLLADGKKPDTQLLAMVQVDAEFITDLVTQGYLEQPTPAPKAGVACDTFDGKRSLATARMFLFDLTERMLTRRDPPLSRQMRANLREARDRITMLSVAEELLSHIALHAGESRAEDISARLAMLLPEEALA